ncbi:ankyrin repeat domain-containing protein 17-like [Bicyclus anynana]|uniref:Ankyrin repeat domain-containing protein 17-like n=1 Tax=Bicyclus anynana TaxID=110368 RepID=A0ABM3M0J0_BICAN|nr:ankyrin repeat domain-containing protein 17-like [Bicyclus anynana]
MSLQQHLVHKFSSWKPPPPAVEGRSSGDVTLSFSAGVYSCLTDRLLYRVEKKEKIPPWVLVYSGGKTTKRIDNLAPCHPHRFRLQLVVRPSAVSGLADTLAQRCGGEQAARELLADGDESQGGEERRTDTPWLQSQWSDETWTSTESDGTAAACFCMAVRCGYLKQVQQMLEERPQLLSVINYSNGYTPLATAARKGDVNMVRYLVGAGAELEQRSSAGQTPLQLAVLCGHTAVADLLLEKGADFQARDLNQLRVEHYAVDSCAPDVLRLVLDRGGDVHVRDSNGWTPLFRAVCQGAKSEVIEELVRRGSDVEATDRRQLTVGAVAKLLKDRQGRRRESVLRAVDGQYQHEKVIANFTRLTKKISNFNNLFKH